MINSLGQPNLRKSELDTPALLVDLGQLQANIARIVQTCRRLGVSWRPHIKGIKTVEIVRMELAAGATGITCAKLGEAEVMAGAGIRNILIANQIVGELKIRRLMSLLDQADVIVAMDSPENLAALAEAAKNARKTLRVVIEVNIGMNRAGVEPGAPVVALAGMIAQHPSLRLMGLMGWESHAVAIEDQDEKAKSVAKAISSLTASAKACREAGHNIEIVSCGGTGTFPFCAQQPGVTEVQVGGAVFSDEHYRTHYHFDYPCALSILATVTSRPNPSRIILDAGKKAMSGDAALPRPVNLSDLRSMRLSAEHTTIELNSQSDLPRVGDKVELVVGYSDTTVHLHEHIVAMRGDQVEAVWNVAARGKIK
jgi:D-serine deaminase-like pyridoxal phosphate-dependent protein